MENSNLHGEAPLLVVQEPELRLPQGTWESCNWEKTLMIQNPEKTPKPQSEKVWYHSAGEAGAQVHLP